MLYERVSRNVMKKVRADALAALPEPHCHRILQHVPNRGKSAGGGGSLRPAELELIRPGAVVMMREVADVDPRHIIRPVGGGRRRIFDLQKECKDLGLSTTGAEPPEELAERLRTVEVGQWRAVAAAGKSGKLETKVEKDSALVELEQDSSGVWWAAANGLAVGGRCEVRSHGLAAAIIPTWRIPAAAVTL